MPRVRKKWGLRLRKRTFCHLRPTKAQNQHAHSRGLIRVFVVRMKNHCSFGYPNAPNEDSDQTAQTAQSDQYLRWAHMSKGTFSDDAAHIKSYENKHATLFS